MLTPAGQSLGFGGTAHLTYTGPATQLGAIYFDGQLLDAGPMGDALCTGDVIDLPWTWFGDTVAHQVDFRVYAVDFVEGGPLPTYADAYEVNARISVEPSAPTTTFSAPSLGALQVGQPVNVSVDLGTLTTGFDWTYGGSLDVSGLPVGLAATLANPSADDDQWSDDGVSPHLRIVGAPTAPGARSVVFAVADGFGAMALATRSYTVVGAPKTPLAPPARTLNGSGRSTFIVAGLTPSARIIPATKVRGVKSITTARSAATLETVANFSGVIRQRVSVVDQGRTTVLTLVLQVRPNAPARVTFTPQVGRTVVRWNPSSNASGYRVLVNGNQAAQLSPRTRAYVIKNVLNAHSNVNVMATGGGLTSTATRAVLVK
jgi:hypothetical protein